MDVHITITDNRALVIHKGNHRTAGLLQAAINEGMETVSAWFDNTPDKVAFSWKTVEIKVTRSR